MNGVLDAWAPCFSRSSASGPARHTLGHVAPFGVHRLDHGDQVVAGRLHAAGSDRHVDIRRDGFQQRRLGRGLGQGREQYPV